VARGGEDTGEVATRPVAAEDVGEVVLDTARDTAVLPLALALLLLLLLLQGLLVLVLLLLPLEGAPLEEPAALPALGPAAALALPPPLGPALPVFSLGRGSL
jgi:hypothetical protein